MEPIIQWVTLFQNWLVWEIEGTWKFLQSHISIFYIPHSSFIVREIERFIFTWDACALISTPLPLSHFQHQSDERDTVLSICFLLSMTNWTVHCRFHGKNSKAIPASLIAFHNNHAYCFSSWLSQYLTPFIYIWVLKHRWK